MTKMNITFFIGNEVLNIFYLTIFSKKATFSEKMVKKKFRGTRLFFRGWGHLTPKINITFFITNKVLSIFMLNNFFG